MAHTAEPGPAHQAFIQALHEVAGRFEQALPPTHRLAIVAQFLGQQIADIDDTQYGPGEIMQVVAHNIESGNARANGSGSSLPVIGHG